MKAIVAWCILLVAPTSMASLAAERTSAIVSVSWDLSLGSDGRVAALSTRDTTVPKLHAYLEKAIRSWRFTPGKVDGKPAPTRTHLHTRIEVRLAGDSFEIRLLDASTGATYATKPTAKYPDWMGRHRKQGLVLVIARYDERGAVIDVAPYDLKNRVDKGLVEAALSAAKYWTFLPEVVDGHPLAGEAAIPVCFRLNGLNPPDCEWKNPRTGANGSSDAVALDPVARLDSDVIGSVL
ncbi:hypothetical protein [Dokdonella sp.]|uniref:hypothetical protein n=1 Tax=Dokdonella sp. TaxID=2291710 RepID=UPI002F40405E